jgi:colicin import membrane protein
MGSVRQVEFVENRVVDGEASSGGSLAGPPRPAGALETLLDHRPAFRGSVRGYDRLEVDNYVAWAEGELATAQREREHLLDRLSAGAAELEISRRLLAERPHPRPVVSDRVGEILRLAEDQAAEVLAAAEGEAGRIIADARLEADARLRKAHEIRELAGNVADQLRADAQRDRAEAAALLAQAGRGAEALAREAAEERERQAAAALAERDRIAADVADLHRQREQVRATLRELTDRLGEALRAVGVSDADADDLVLAGGPGEPVPV